MTSRLSDFFTSKNQNRFNFFCSHPSFLSNPLHFLTCYHGFVAQILGPNNDTIEFMFAGINMFWT